MSPKSNQFKSSSKHIFLPNYTDFWSVVFSYCTDRWTHEDGQDEEIAYFAASLDRRVNIVLASIIYINLHIAN